MYERIPDELKKLDRWVCWRFEIRDGKPSKVPINPLTGSRAMSNNPATWGCFEDAVSHQYDTSKEGNQNKGIGFMFYNDGIIGVDLDHCKDEVGNLTDEAKDIIGILDSYTEFSQSGQGIHIICYGNMPEGRKRKSNVEMYSSGRFFIMTGNALDDGHTDIEDRTEELAEVHKKYLADKKKEKKTAAAVTDLELDDKTLIEKAIASDNGSRFNALYNGDTSGNGNDDSAADLAFCNLLAFWTRCNAGQMDRIFRQSGLMRGKWDERHGADTYGNITIQKAISDCSTVYEPKGKKLKQAALEDPEIDNGLDALVKSADKKNNEELPKWVYGPYNDMWNAQRLIDFAGQDIRYNVDAGWYIWNGRFWEEDRKDRIRTLADEAINNLYKYESAIHLKDKTDKKVIHKAFKDWITKARNTGRKDNMIRECQSWPDISVTSEQFDRNNWLLNCINGIIDLKSGKLMKHDKNELITRIIPIEYLPDQECPLWDSFLNKIFAGNTDIISFIQRAIGYSLTGSIKEQCMFILHGVGKNGKSTFLDTIRYLLGGYTRNANASAFMKTEKSNADEVARLQGARFVTTTEPEKNEQFSESFIKQATGGEPLTARYLYKNSFEFTPEFKIWMGTNHKPKILGNDLGIWRRIRLIPFNVIISEQEKDTELGKKLLAELPGILNWAIKGCLMWQKVGLQEPNEVLMATEDYKIEMDSLQLFLDECTVSNAESFVKSGDLYIVYEKWADINGEKPMSSTKLSLNLKERGINRGRTKVMRTWDGIELSKYGKRLLMGAPADQKEEYEQCKMPWNS